MRSEVKVRLVDMRSEVKVRLVKVRLHHSL